MSVSVVIPFKSEDPHRLVSWAWVRGWWKINFPDWEKRVASSDPFTKAKSVNLGVKDTTGDVVLVADSDCYIPDALLLQQLVNKVQSGKQLWMTPHKHVYRLTEKESKTVYDTGSIDRSTLRTRSIGCVGGGLIILSREAWESVGGFDERYEGWGGEDVSFGMSLESLCGPQPRGTLDLIHLWHPPLHSNYKIPPKTVNLIQEYRRASRHPDRMRALIAGRE